MDLRKRGHFAPAIFEHMPVFKWLLLDQTLLTHNEFLCIIFDHSACCISNFRGMVLNVTEWQQVENMRVFENCRSKVTPFLKSAHIVLLYYLQLHSYFKDKHFALVHVSIFFSRKTTRM